MNSLRQFWRSRPPAVRLAVAYVAIIMVISLFFSLSLYRLSAGQLEAGLRRQYFRYQFFRQDGLRPPNISQIQDELDAGKTRLQLQLVYFNVIILVFGSGVSYWLAKRTLRPIEDALEAQSRFTADASHELRTPLAAMQAEIEVALRGQKLPKEANKLLESNLEEVAKLKALSDGLLKLARNNGNGLEFEPVKLALVATEVVKLIKPAAERRKIAIANEVTDLTIMGDAPSLVELLIILVDNAIKYSEPNTTVTLSSRRHGKHGYLIVADKGHGIQASHLPHVFERFYRIDSSRSKEKVDGYGLGLAIAKQITERHHGGVEVTSTPGQGSTFTIKLPLAQEE